MNTKITVSGNNSFDVVERENYPTRAAALKAAGAYKKPLVDTIDVEYLAGGKMECWSCDGNKRATSEPGVYKWSFSSWQHTGTFPA